jgi:hypothetical protein
MEYGYERGQCSRCYGTVYRLPRWEYKRTSPFVSFTEQWDVSEPIALNYERVQVYDYYTHPEGRRVTFCPGCGCLIR